jgi:hypothetical protein
MMQLKRSLGACTSSFWRSVQGYSIPTCTINWFIMFSLYAILYILLRSLTFSFMHVLFFIQACSHRGNYHMFSTLCNILTYLLYFYLVFANFFHFYSLNVLTSFTPTLKFTWTWYTNSQSCLFIYFYSIFCFLTVHILIW